MRLRSLILLLCVLGAASVLAEEAPPVPKVGNPHGNMDLDCKLCHAQGSWEVSGKGEFDHNATGFPLEGLHKHALCRDCHREPVFAHVGTQCADCHTDSHRGRLGPVCSDCHTPAAWVDQPQMRKEHNATALPLVGAHERVDCDACHSGAATGDYVGTPSACYACHADTYASTDNPDHRMAGFGTDCERCHGVFSATWGSGDFIHDQGFPLTGAHGRTSCIECHSNGFAGTPTACAACHQPAYDNTTNPGHVAAGFPVTCALCHTTAAWIPGQYDHNATAFPLTGAHRTADCLSCHSTGYTGTPTDCSACHQADFNGTTDPNHQSSNFPVSCQDCHTTNAWEPSTWDHDSLFPIDSGSHRGKWNSCTECHVVQSNYAAFECILCHEHSRSTTDGDHGGVQNYQYLSSACFECHPRGRQ
jgi:hypothetical protein